MGLLPSGDSDSGDGEVREAEIVEEEEESRGEKAG